MSTERILEKAASTRKQMEDISANITTMVILYVKGLAENLRRIVNKYDIRTAFNAKNTIRSPLTKIRPTQENRDPKNCIYKYRVNLDININEQRSALSTSG